MSVRDTKRSKSSRIYEYFNNAKAKIRPLKSGSDLSALLKLRKLIIIIAVILLMIFVFGVVSTVKYNSDYINIKQLGT